MNYTRRTKGIGGLTTRVLDHSLAYKDKGEVHRLRAVMWGDQGEFAKGWGELALSALPLAYALAVMVLAIGLVFTTMMYDLAAVVAGAVKHRPVEGVGGPGEEHGGEAEG